MARHPTGRPTDLELEILKVLWDAGPSTVREVMDTLTQTRRAGYTTVLKILQIMREKELVVCNDRERPHVYRARKSRKVTLRQLAGDLLDRAFEGSTSQLMLRALEHKKARPEELAELTGLLDRLEKGTS